jgi:hypothetical protein
MVDIFEATFPYSSSFNDTSPDFALDNMETVQNLDHPVEDYFLNSNYFYSDTAPVSSPSSIIPAPHNVPSSPAPNVQAPNIPSPVVMSLSPALPASPAFAHTNTLVSSASGRSHCPVVPTTEHPDEGPRRTARRHVPSTREQVLNAIGSSNPRIFSVSGEAKENNEPVVMPAPKRKAKSTNQSNK